VRGASSKIGSSHAFPLVDAALITIAHTKRPPGRRFVRATAIFALGMPGLHAQR
jgi:hypothetical protein